MEKTDQPQPRVGMGKTACWRHLRTELWTWMGTRSMGTGERKGG